MSSRADLQQKFLGPGFQYLEKFNLAFGFFLEICSISNEAVFFVDLHVIDKIDGLRLDKTFGQ